MYIEFDLPAGAGGHSIAYVNSMISQNLKDWSEKYDIPYTTKNHKYTKRVTFDNDEYYSFFALTWMPEAEYLASYVTNFRLVEPMNRV